MTQDELANKLLVNKSSIQKYESGAVFNLKMETIRDLCQLFSIPS
jgi:DNA-binding XRE family transcriptional regulator